MVCSTYAVNGQVNTVRIILHCYFAAVFFKYCLVMFFIFMQINYWVTFVAECVLEPLGSRFDPGQEDKPHSSDGAL